MEKGKIRIKTDNIFPIIKKFLYSDHEIFLRELISNAVDASKKLKKLNSIGEAKGDIGELRIEVKIDSEAGTLHVIDNGIGMTSDEVKKYINDLAFSGATDFLDKYKNLEEGGQLIGNFGLGFYSAFMVADRVDLITKSFKDEPAVKWSCDGSPKFTMEGYPEKEDRGTEVVLHISEDSKEFLEEFRIKGILEKYCKFLPIPIKFGQNVTTEKGENEGDEEIKIYTDRIINNSNPAWTKSPSSLEDKDYLDFYRELHPFSEDPLFWIHLNVDYPFNLTGILYFPKLQKNSYEMQKNKIQLYSRQVFITDAVEEIVPEFLTLLHGVLDSPDIPLNVSRSYLQSDSNVKKITAHISKKVGDRLAELFKKERESFEEKWDNIGVFVKYGMISDEKFFEKAKDYALYKNLNDEHFTLEEYREKIKANQTDKNGKLVVLYTTDEEAQTTYINSAKNHGLDVLRFDTVIDSHFIGAIERKFDDITFTRVDADTPDKLIETDQQLESVLSDKEEEKLKTAFETIVNGGGMQVVMKALSPSDLPVMITKPEFSRRMKEMAEMGGGNPFYGNMPESVNLVVNTNHPLASKIIRSKAKKEVMVQHLYDLALLSQSMLKGDDLNRFISRSVEVMEN